MSLQIQQHRIILTRDQAEDAGQLHRARYFGQCSLADAYVKYAKLMNIFPNHDICTTTWYAPYNAALAAARAERGLPAVQVEKTEVQQDFATDNLIVKHTVNWSPAHTDPRALYGSHGL